MGRKQSAQPAGSLVNVAVLAAIRNPLTYLVPPSLDVRPGQRVLVPLGTRRATGIVIEPVAHSAAQVPQSVTGVPFRLKATVAGTILTLRLDGVLKVTVPDPIYAIGSLGVLIDTGLTGTHAADNFCAVLRAGTCP